MDYAKHYISLDSVPKLRGEMSWNTGAAYTKLQWKRVNSLVNSIDYGILPLYGSGRSSYDTIAAIGKLLGKSGKDCVILSLINWMVAACFAFLIRFFVEKESVTCIVAGILLTMLAYGLYCLDATDFKFNVPVWCSRNSSDSSSRKYIKLPIPFYVIYIWLCLGLTCELLYKKTGMRDAVRYNVICGAGLVVLALGFAFRSIRPVVVGRLQYLVQMLTNNVICCVLAIVTWFATIKQSVNRLPYKISLFEYLIMAISLLNIAMFMLIHEIYLYYKSMKISNSN